MMYSKDRYMGGWSVYARAYGEGIMTFTYDEERKMIPVWIPRWKAIRLAMTVLEAFNYGHWELTEQEEKPRQIEDTHIVYGPIDELPPYCPYEKCLQLFVSDADPAAHDCRRCLKADFPEGYDTSITTKIEGKP